MASKLLFYNWPDAFQPDLLWQWPIQTAFPLTQVFFQMKQDSSNLSKYIFSTICIYQPILLVENKLVIIKAYTNTYCVYVNICISGIGRHSLTESTLEGYICHPMTVIHSFLLYITCIHYKPLVVDKLRRKTSSWPYVSCACSLADIKKLKMTPNIHY